MTNDGKLSAALLEALNSPTRAAPLWGLAYVKYPDRELQPCTLPDGTTQFSLAKWGCEYKHCGPRPKKSSPADTAAIMAALNHAFAPCYTVRSVTDQSTHINIVMEEKRSENIINILRPYR